MRKLLVTAAALVGLAVPATAHAVDVPVDVQIVPVGNGLYAWTCSGTANPLHVSNYTLICNGQTAVGVHPVKATAGVSATPRVCYRLTFWYSGGIASREACETL